MRPFKAQQSSAVNAITLRRLTRRPPSYVVDGDQWSKMTKRSVSNAASRLLRSCLISSKIKRSAEKHQCTRIRYQVNSLMFSFVPSQFVEVLPKYDKARIQGDVQKLL
ncbi:hypothetical protein EVAR_68449_1 [Eumeta japonica]|uniref:Uncharacterized protein n=1 Tax=Eumeta variegata TaxID=151549 RepID=A0A4C1ST74_EUMVA|nr:hypothetical protein EVAR_68449_1 [Eumeta japonica]